MPLMHGNYRVVGMSLLCYLMLCSGFNLLMAHLMVVDNHQIWQSDALQPIDILAFVQLLGLILSGSAFLLFVLNPLSAFRGWLRTIVGTLGLMTGLLLKIVGVVTPLQEITFHGHHQLIREYLFVDFAPITALALLVADCWFCLGISFVWESLERKKTVATA